jgi:hypothetical protein
MLHALTNYKDEKIIGCIKICTFAYLKDNIVPQDPIYTDHHHPYTPPFLQGYEIYPGG